MIKYKYLKYSLFFLLLLISLVVLFIARASHKPLDIGIILKYVNQEAINKIIPQNKLESASILLNLFENTIKFNLNEVQNFKLKVNKSGDEVLISTADNINIGLSATSLLRKKFVLKYFHIRGADIQASSKLGSLSLYGGNNPFNIDNNLLSLKEIKISDSNLTLKLLDNLEKITFSGMNIVVNKDHKNIKINNFYVKEINYKDKMNTVLFNLIDTKIFTKDKTIVGDVNKAHINNLHYIGLTKEQLKKLSFLRNKIILQDSKFEISLNREFSLSSNFNGFGSKIPLKVNGDFTKKFLFNADIIVKLNSFIVPEKNLNEINFYNLSLVNAKKIVADGEISLKIFQNKLLAGSFYINLKNKFNKDLILVNEDLYIPFPIDNLLLKANLLENQIEIERLSANNSRSSFNIKGKVKNINTNFYANLDISVNSLNLIEFNELLNKNQNKVFKDKYKFVKFKSGFLKDTLFNLEYKDNNLFLNSLSGSLLNLEILFDNNLKFDIENAILSLNKDKKFQAFSEKINLTSDSKNLSLKQNLLIFKNFNDLSFSSSFSTNYKNLFTILKKITSQSTNAIPILAIEGQVDAKINLYKSGKETSTLQHNLSGKLNKFNFIKNDKDFPISIEDFNGNFLLINNVLNIDGFAKINKSDSKIKILLNEQKKLKIDINALAAASSFDFLKEYNFLKSGVTMLKMTILKDVMSDNNWTAMVEGNLYNNAVEINQVLYTKKEKERGLLKGKYYFQGATLKQVEDLTLITNDIIMRGDIFLNSQGYLEKINVKEFVRELDNYKALIKFADNKKFNLSITGSSVNIDNYFNEDNNTRNNGTISVSTENFYLNNLNFGSVKFNSTIENNYINYLKGNIYNKEKSYVNFNYNYDREKNSKLNINFEDFGLFLLNLDLSNKFLSGNGTIVVDIDNKKKKITSGKYLIKNFSIKDASFLARLLQLASFTGLLEILASEGIPFTNLEGKFIVKDTKVIIKDTRFEGLSLGASTKGSIDLVNKTLDMRGVLIPAYAISDIINKIPLLGQIITGIEGEGIIGFNYKAFGSYENPEYSINPFSVLTPGIIRSIFNDVSEETEEE